MQKSVNPKNKNAFSFIDVKVAIVGSGAAGLNAALSLKRFGVDDIVVVTEGLGMGASANTGSDKQTYYRLNPGYVKDSALDMARTLFSGGCMHGDTALVESALSLPGYCNLASIGVSFPHDKYGVYAGFKTDHDPCSRGSSAGPRTSIIMYEKLAAETRRLGVNFIEGYDAVKIVTSGTEKNRRAEGLILVERYPAKGKTPAAKAIRAEYVIFATGGPAALYADSVYPESQTGSLGIAFEAGAAAQNLTESQFGLASLKPRWNLSGSYQQILPAYVSTEPDGSDERNFLEEYFPDFDSMLNAQFLKGYQWPFDIRKINDHGSSLIDIAVYHEMKIRNRRVFLDFRRNPSYKGKKFNIEKLPDVAKQYLVNSRSMQAVPIKRLRAMNPLSYELYKSKGVDLEKEMLEIAVCNQHLNGGIAVDIWWESTVKNFFAVGECAGTHGIYRPGGSALNSGQVGSYRAAQCISWRIEKKNKNVRTKAVDTALSAMNSTISGLLKNKRKIDVKTELKDIQKLMSETMGIIRNPSSLCSAIRKNAEMLALHDDSGVSAPGLVPMYFRNRDMLVAQKMFLESAKSLFSQLKEGRGSYIKGDIDRIGDILKNNLHVNADESLNGRIHQVCMQPDGRIKVSWTDVRPVPDKESWFEDIWAQYQNRQYR